MPDSGDLCGVAKSITATQCPSFCTPRALGGGDKRACLLRIEGWAACISEESCF